MRRIIIAASFVCLQALQANSLFAQEPPSYLIVRPTSRVVPDCHSDKWKPTKNHYVSRAPYAYGYFGASASDKWYRSSNYNRSYTQWQRR